MSQQAANFRQMHHGSAPLRLPNAWDAGSARLFESLGAPAIATTSAGVAWAQGYADGGQMPADAAIGAAVSMARVLRVPLSVDFENGYSDDPKTVGDNIRRLLDAGVAGINIEDGREPPAKLAAKIEAIKRAASNAGTDIFVNARTDVFLAGLVDASERVKETLARGATYRAAGADGLFVPGICDAADIAAVTSGTDLPINVLAWPGLAPSETLGQLGVRRLSAGSGIVQMLWGQAAKLARDFLDHGRSDALADGMSYPQLQGLFNAR